jgi:hypothetical protein
MLNQLRGLEAAVLLVDGGDCFFPGSTLKAPSKPQERIETRKARQIVNALNLLGYQAIGLGPADFQLGLEVLRELEKTARFPFVSTNLVERATRKHLFRPHVVVEAGGVKFGIFSLLMNTLNQSYLNRVLPDAEVLDPETVAREVVPELRKICDVVVCLSQLNVDTNETILSANPGIDVLVDPLSKLGSKAVFIAEGEYIADVHGTPVVRVDGQGSRVGVLELYFAAGSRKFAAYRGYDAALEPHVQSHPEMVRLLASFEGNRTEPWKVDFDASRPRLTEEYLGVEECSGCHEEQHRFWASTKHAAAYSTLEKTSDHLRPDCVGCHTFGYGITFANAKTVGTWKEVQCESCHGSKQAHAENPKVARMGPVAEETCWGCHNPAITKKDFNYAGTREAASCPKIQR